MSGAADAHPTPPPLVLASASPRRRALLAQLGLAFAVLAPEIDETPAPGEDGAGLTRRLAGAKAAAVARERAGALILAADTVVVLEERPLGKPADADEAAAMLVALRGRAHQVLTGVCAVDARGQARSAVMSTTVWMRHYSDAELMAYVASGDPLDKAGSYAIQHPSFRPVKRLRGCANNVVGLPLCLTSALLQLAGATLPADNHSC